MTIIQGLQRPKIRGGRLPAGETPLTQNEIVSLVPNVECAGSAGAIPCAYAHVAENARAGMRVLHDDGLIELKVLEGEGRAGRRGRRAQFRTAVESFATVRAQEEIGADKATFRTACQKISSDSHFLGLWESTWTRHT